MVKGGQAASDKCGLLNGQDLWVCVSPCAGREHIKLDEVGVGVGPEAWLIGKEASLADVDVTKVREPMSCVRIIGYRDVQKIDSIRRGEIEYKDDEPAVRTGRVNYTLVEEDHWVGLACDAEAVPRKESWKGRWT